MLDSSGAISDALLSLLDENDLRRVIYYEMGHPELPATLPEFFPIYGVTEEENVQRVIENMKRLAPHLVQLAPVIGWLSLVELTPEVLRLCIAIKNEYDESWQITEVKRLLSEETLMVNALKNFGDRVPNAKYYLFSSYVNLKESEKDLRRHAPVSLLDAVEPKESRAGLGYFKPSWTPKEAIEKGQLVIVNGAMLINQPMAQHYCFTQIFSLIMQQVNKRIPNDPNDQPLAIVMDEVFSLLSIPGMAEEIAKISPFYRSRKVEPYIVVQKLSQFAENLRKEIWGIGNLMCFAVADMTEAYEIAQQLFPYISTRVKLPAKNENQNPITESDRGWYLEIANWIQRLNHRECIIRRYNSERELDKYIHHVPMTNDTPPTHPTSQLWERKQALIEKIGVRIRDALEVINNRKLGPGGTSGPPQAH